MKVLFGYALISILVGAIGLAIGLMCEMIYEYKHGGEWSYLGAAIWFFFLAVAAFLLAVSIFLLTL